VLLVFGAPCQLRSLAEQEHGRTIPLADMERLTRGCSAPADRAFRRAAAIGRLAPHILLSREHDVVADATSAFANLIEGHDHDDSNISAYRVAPMSIKFEGEPPFYLGIAETASAHVLDTTVVVRLTVSAPEMRPKPRHSSIHGSVGSCESPSRAIADGRENGGDSQAALRLGTWLDPLGVCTY
jgi:hypothetical protein